MRNALKVLAVVLLVAVCVTAQTTAPEKDGGPVVLQKNEGEAAHSASTRRGIVAQ